MSVRTTILRTSVLAFVLMSSVALLPLPAKAGGGCHGGPIIDAEGSTVGLRDLCFTPTVIRIQPGQKVTWSNKDETDHTVTGVGFSWGSGETLTPGKSVSYRFGKPGIYVYACLLHPGMVGAVVAGNGGVPAASGNTTGDSSAVSLVVSPLPPNPKAPATAATKVTTTSSAGVWKGIALGAIALLVLMGVALVAQRGRALKTESVQRAGA